MSIRDTSELHCFGEEGEDDLSALRRTYPRWTIWRGRSEQGDATGWYATRAHQPDLTGERDERGLHCTLDADTAEELKALLERQEHLIQQLSAPAIPSG